MIKEISKRKWKFLQFPVMNDGAEYLAIGMLKRRNIESYKAPPRQANFDLVCIHPEGLNTRCVRIQVKSRYGTHGTGVPIKTSTLGKFDFLIVVALNVGNFGNGRDGSTGACPPDIYVFPRRIVLKHFNPKGWGQGRESSFSRHFEALRGTRTIKVLKWWHVV
jgi:hypothetical protein